MGALPRVRHRIYIDVAAHNQVKKTSWRLWHTITLIAVLLIVLGLQTVVGVFWCLFNSDTDTESGKDKMAEARATRNKLVALHKKRVKEVTKLNKDGPSRKSLALLNVLSGLKAKIEIVEFLPEAKQLLDILQQWENHPGVKSAMK